MADLVNVHRDRVLRADRALGRHQVQVVTQEPARDEQELGLAGLAADVHVHELADVLAVLRYDVQLVPVRDLEW